ncbi:MAG: alcohol dehydrogenase catalytic domain-containing protein [bacterium]|nr:alcohol dehydrogenase catalytic domain-containing protein [bacterium]
MKMKAAVLRNIGGPLKIEELEVPKLKKGQVLVEVLYSGLCRSNINEIDGRKGAEFIPHLTGHEASAIVMEVGSGVTKVKATDYVVCSWINGSGLTAQPVKYKSAKGMVNAGTCSTFCEYAIVSENKVVSISEEVNTRAAALLGCAVPTGAGVIDHFGIKPGQKLAVFGIGGIGASALMRANALGIHCIAFDVLEWKLQWVSENFKIEAFHFNKFRYRNFFDFAIECSGNKLAMEMTFECLNSNGTAIIAGNLKPGENISIDPFGLVRGKKLLGTWGGECFLDKDIPFYAKEHLEGRFPVEKLITGSYNFNGINNGIRDLKDGNLIRGIIKF